MKSIGELIPLSSSFLQQKGLKEPRRQVEELLAFTLGLKRIDLYLQYDRPVEENELGIFREALRRMAKHEPFEYIIGEVEFYGCKIKVNPSVLIPRPETEILVDLLVKKLKSEDLQGKVLWDLCTGSGCIAIALKKVFPSLTVVASDLSREALKVARENAERNEIQIDFREGDLLIPFQGQKANYIVSNPPYISENEYLGLDPSVALFEPKMALVGGKNGAEFYERLASGLFSHLNEGGEAFFEIGSTQKELLTKIFSTHSWTHFSIKQDWAGLDRFFFLEKQ